MTRRIDEWLRRAGLAPLQRPAWVEVDVDVLTQNASALGSYAHPAAIAVVVKADGYGHGLEMAARCAVAGGASWLCVADAGEAQRLRADGYEGRIFVLYPVPDGVQPMMATLGVDVSVGSVSDARHLMENLSRDGPVLAVHLEVDTGMTRGGVLPDETLEAARVVAAGPLTRLAGVWTHLAAPEDPARNSVQLAHFGSVLSELSAADIDPEAVHVSASGGLFAVDTKADSFVRPGLVYYGVHPRPGHPLPSNVGPALAVRAHALRIADVAAGTAVGYAGTWVAARPSRIATLPIGYADGWSRASSPGGRTLVEGQEAPLVGRISSDSLTVDVTDVEGIGSDSEFTLLGRNGALTVTADEIADVRATISWEVLQQLGSRLSRIYVSSGRTLAIRPESSTAIISAGGARLPRY